MTESPDREKDREENREERPDEPPAARASAEVEPDKPPRYEGETIFDWACREDVRELVSRIRINEPVEVEGKKAERRVAEFPGPVTQEQAETQIKRSGGYIVYVYGPHRGRFINTDRPVWLDPRSTSDAPVSEAQSAATTEKRNDAAPTGVPSWVQQLLDEQRREMKSVHERERAEQKETIQELRAELNALRQRAESEPKENPVSVAVEIAKAMRPQESKNLEFEQARQIEREAYERANADAKKVARAELYHELREEVAAQLRIELREQREANEAHSAKLDEREKAQAEREQEAETFEAELTERAEGLDAREQELTAYAQKLKTYEEGLRLEKARLEGARQAVAAPPAQESKAQPQQSALDLQLQLPKHLESLFATSEPDSDDIEEGEDAEEAA